MARSLFWATEGRSRFYELLQRRGRSTQSFTHSICSGLMRLLRSLSKATIRPAVRRPHRAEQWSSSGCSASGNLKGIVAKLKHGRGRVGSTPQSAIFAARGAAGIVREHLSRKEVTLLDYIV
jgi:hypothetical protein